MDETYIIILNSGRMIFTDGWESTATLRRSIRAEWDAACVRDDECGIYCQHPRHKDAGQVCTLINPDHVSAIVAPTYA